MKASIHYLLPLMLLIGCKKSTIRQDDLNALKNKNFTTESYKNSTKIISVGDENHFIEVPKSERFIEESANTLLAKKLDTSLIEFQKTLDLPQAFVERKFIKGYSDFKDKLELFVGMIVKETKPDNYILIGDFKLNPEEVKANVPSEGVLFDRSYDSKFGASAAAFLINAQLDNNTAYSITVSDASTAILAEKNIDKKRIYNIYSKDPEISKYFLIRTATTSCLLYKQYKKLDGKVKFSSGAINIDGNYYTENSYLKRDWKVGVILTPINEINKTYLETKKQKN